MSLLLTILTNGVIIILMLSVLVAAHELGHYLFARLFGMGVEEFAIGMGGKPLTQYMTKTYRIPLAPGEDANARSSAMGFEAGKGIKVPDPVVIEVDGQSALVESTAFTIRPWPLGGFVRIKGMVPEEDGSEVRIPGGFYSKAPWQRIVVLVAGPAFSVLTGVFILAGLYLAMGVPRSSTKVDDVLKDGPAYKAGLRKGDKFVFINGKPITSYFELVSNVRDNGGKEIQVQVEREGKLLSFAMVPKIAPEETDVIGPDNMPTGEKRRQARMGAVFYPTNVKVSAPVALAEAAYWPVKVVTMLGGLVKRPSQAGENLGGPITIVTQTSKAIDRGPADVIGTSALLSISVGIFNLLPIFPLDGGQIVVALAEMLRGGRRLSYKVQNLVGNVGVLLLLLMVITVSSFDVGKLIKGDEKPPVKAKK